MKEYKFENVSITKTLMYLVFSMISVVVTTVLVAKFINPGIFPAINFFGLSVILFFVGKKIIPRNITISLTKDELNYKNKKHLWSELESFRFDESPYLNILTLRFSKTTLKLNNPKKSTDKEVYIKFQKSVRKRINELNATRSFSDKIKEKGFYNSKYARPYAYFMISLMVIWALFMIFSPQNFKFSNFGLFLVVLGGLIPLLMRIFGSKKTVD